MLLKIIFPAILQLLGIGVIISEFFIPSGGMLSILSLGLLAYSIYYVFVSLSAFAGYCVITVDLIIVPIVVLYGINVIVKSRVALRSELSSKDGVVSQADDLVQFVGKKGTTVSHLHPSGIALIDERRVDVVTSGEFINKNTAVEVVEVNGNRVIVRAVSSNS
jgi:membrane-bound ClpP family serine protease